MNIPLPDDLKAFVDTRGAAHACGSSSEYLRELIRKQRDVEKLRSMLMEGFNSGPGEVVTEDTFRQMREELHEHLVQ